MIHSLISTIFLSTVFFLPSLAFNSNSNQNVAVYWGQNSAGSQQSLGDYCKSSDADIFLLSFLNDFPDMNLDLSSACSGMGDCSSVGKDIKSCQQQGKIVLLSMGGASGQYGFNGDDDGEQFAQKLWDTFGGGSGSQRPFGDAVVDGFDFDIENKNPKGYAALGKALKNKFQGGNKQFYISAAPQCVYPDASVGDLLKNAQVDFAFIQFYNNYCNVDGQFNWDTWAKFAENSSPNKDIKLFLGLPGSSSAAGSGYIEDISSLESTISKISGGSNFGGVALWDASQAFSNKIDGQTYISEVKKALGSDSSNSSPSSSSSAAPSSSTSPSASSSSAPSSSISPSASSSSAPSSSISPSASSSSAPSSSISPSASSSAAPSSSTLSTASSSGVSSTQGSPSPTSVSTNAASNVPSSTSTTSLPSSTAFSPSPSGSSAPTTRVSSSTPVPSSRSTTTLAPSSSSTSGGSNAYSSAVSLNQKYAKGYTNQGQCKSGELACTSDGSFAICNNGSWSITKCAAGTTCFAYDANDSVFTSCNAQNLKSNYF